MFSSLFCQQTLTNLAGIAQNISLVISFCSQILTDTVASVYSTFNLFFSETESKRSDRFYPGWWKIERREKESQKEQR